jgi:hypothetical protein
MDWEGGPKQSGEYMEQDPQLNINYGFDNFTFAIWFKADHTNHRSPTSLGQIFRLNQEGFENSGTGGDLLELSRQSSTSVGNRLVFQISELSVANNKSYRYGGQVRPGYWFHGLWTYDGTTLLGYLNGLFTTPSILADDSVNIRNVDRSGQMGRRATGSSFFDGRIHSIALWDTALSAAAALEVHNGGDGCNSNLAVDSGSYTQSANLLHWWRLGFNRDNVGEDTGVSGSPLIDYVSGFSMTSQDIANDCPRGSAKSNAQIVSVDMNGTDENFINDGPNLMGFGNAFTYSQWVKVNVAFVGTDFWMSGIKTDLTANNRFELSRASAGGQPRFTFWDTAGTVIKDFTFPDNIPEVGTWVMMTFTWDGTDLKGYFDGVEDTNPTKSTDNAGSRADQAVQLGVGNASTAGNELPQNILYAAFWDVALSQAEITAIHNSGVGGDVDLSSDRGDYVSSSDLQHWWRFGHNSADMGADSGNASTLIDMGADSENLTNIDIVALAPPSSPVYVGSMEFNGTDESMGNSTDQDLSFGVDFSIMITFRRRSDTVGLDDNATLFSIESGSDNENEIFVQSLGTVANDPIAVTLRDEFANNHMVFRYNAPTFFSYDAWHQLILTWDGDNTISSGTTEARLRVFEDGSTSSITQSTTTTLVAGRDMVNTDRSITIGNNLAGTQPFSGFIHSIAIWNKDVGGSANEFYNGGFVTLADLTKMSYATNLVHWWKPGVDSTDLGKDFGIGSRAPFTGQVQAAKGGGHAEGAEFWNNINLAPTVDVDVDSVNITSADIDSESPS